VRTWVRKSDDVTKFVHDGCQEIDFSECGIASACANFCAGNDLAELHVVRRGGVDEPTGTASVIVNLNQGGLAADPLGGEPEQAAVEVGDLEPNSFEGRSNSGIDGLPPIDGGACDGVERLLCKRLAGRRISW